MSEQDSIFRIQGPRGIADIIICKPDVSKNASIAYQEFREQVRVQAGTKDEVCAIETDHQRGHILSRKHDVGIFIYFSVAP
jgi:hypothetical protein